MMRMELHVFLNVLLLLNCFYITNGSWNTANAMRYASNPILLVVIQCFLFYDDEKPCVSYSAKETVIKGQCITIRNDVHLHRTMHNLCMHTYIKRLVNSINSVSIRWTYDNHTFTLFVWYHNVLSVVSHKGLSLIYLLRISYATTAVTLFAAFSIVRYTEKQVQTQCKRKCKLRVYLKTL